MSTVWPIIVGLLAFVGALALAAAALVLYAASRAVDEIERWLRTW